MTHRWMRAAAAALALAACGPAPAPAQASPLDGYAEPHGLEGAGRRGERGYDPDEDEWLGRGGLGGSICVTSRGNCVVESAPANAPCSCVVPGFGHKRGAVAN